MGQLVTGFIWCGDEVIIPATKRCKPSEQGYGRAGIGKLAHDPREIDFLMTDLTSQKPKPTTFLESSSAYAQRKALCRSYCRLAEFCDAYSETRVAVPPKVRPPRGFFLKKRPHSKILARARLLWFRSRLSMMQQIDSSALMQFPLLGTEMMERFLIQFSVGHVLIHASLILVVKQD